MNLYRVRLRYPDQTEESRFREGLVCAHSEDEAERVVRGAVWSESGRRNYDGSWTRTHTKLIDNKSNGLLVDEVDIQNWQKPEILYFIQDPEEPE